MIKLKVESSYFFVVHWCVCVSVYIGVFGILSIRVHDDKVFVVWKHKLLEVTVNYWALKLRQRILCILYIMILQANFVLYH